jgi:hypothetical protein
MSQLQTELHHHHLSEAYPQMNPLLLDSSISQNNDQFFGEEVRDSIGSGRSREESSSQGISMISPNELLLGPNHCTFPSYSSSSSSSSMDTCNKRAQHK